MADVYVWSNLPVVTEVKNNEWLGYKMEMCDYIPVTCICLTFVKKNCAIINCSVLFIWCNFCYTTHTQNNYSNKCQTENNGYTKQDIFTIELFTINSYDQTNGSDIKRYILSIVDW